jgi:phosphonate transport system substrate-binding protein
MKSLRYTAFNQNLCYRAFRWQANKRIPSIMVVRKDKKIKFLKDLSRSVIAFLGQAAFTTRVLRRAKPTNCGIHFSEKYVSSYDATYQSVVKGLFPAGDGIRRTLRNVALDIWKRLQTIRTTNGFTRHAFSMHPKNISNEIAIAFLDLFSGAEGKALLKTINFKIIRSADNEDWYDVPALGIDLLPNLIKTPGN